MKDATAIDQLIGETIDGKYRIDVLLGRGGMGAVFKAQHLGTDRAVALKVIAPDYAARADFLARFEREARACGRLRHPNIVDVTDFGYDESTGRRIAYLVMEYLDGCSLADVLRDAKPLPIAWAVDVLQQAGSAVEEAHRAGIVHRDLKPDNIWLEPNRRGGYTVKVLDFGLAKLGQADTEIPSTTERAAETTAAAASVPLPTPDVSDEATMMRGSGFGAGSEPGGAPRTEPALSESTLDEDTRVRSASTPSTRMDTTDSATEVGSIIGTPAYMSPEQCRGLPLTPRSDVYSLGVMAYRMFAGVTPFSGSSEALMTAHISQAPRDVGELRKDLPKPAAALIMRALEKSPEDRPRSAGSFTEMLAAKAQTTRDFLEEAVLMFIQHARTFLSASVVGLSPVLVFSMLAALNAIAFIYGWTLMPRSFGPSIVLAALLATVGPGLLLLQGMVVPAVMQAVVAPLQPMDVKTLQERFKPRLRSYVRAVAPLLVMFIVAGAWQLPMRAITRALRPMTNSDNVGLSIIGLLLIVVLPNLPLFTMFLYLAKTGSVRALQFLGAVAVVEGLPGKEAILRATELAKTDQMAPIRRLLIATSMSVGVLSGLGFGLLARRLPPDVAFGTLAILFGLGFLLLGPFLSVISALTYLRARRALGEPLDKALADFERAVLPESHWKLGERERVATLINAGR